MSTLERMLLRISPEPNSGCWLWDGAVATNGYGSITVARRSWSCHRLMWELTRGPIPRGLWVLHKCDVRSCINPDHLFLGDLAANTNDMLRKGRNAHGRRSGGARLTDEAVRAILQDNRLLRLVAVDHGVDMSTIARVRRGESWRHIQRNHIGERAEARLKAP